MQSKQEETLHRNLKSCLTLSSILQTSLGPLGFDKLFCDDLGDVTCSNDGATILKQLHIQQPAARLLVDLALSQDNSSGDGTTSVVLLSCALLNECYQLYKKGIHVHTLIEGLLESAQYALRFIKKYEIECTQNLLQAVVESSLTSKNVKFYKNFFANLAIKSIENVKEISKIFVKCVAGKSLKDSMIYEGLVINGGRSINGEVTNMENINLLLAEKIENNELIWKRIENLNVNLILMSHEFPFQEISTNIVIFDKIPKEDLEFVSKCLNLEILKGTAISKHLMRNLQKFEFLNIGDEDFIFIKNENFNTILIRGPSISIQEEAKRALNDAIHVAYHTKMTKSVVPGGGATEINLSNELLQCSINILGKKQLVMEAVSKALLIIPRRLALSCGLNPTHIINKIKQSNNTNFGINVLSKNVEDMTKNGIVDSLKSKISMIQLSIEATCMILKIDENLFSNHE